MIKQNIVINIDIDINTSINLQVLDIYQIKIIDLYKKAININNIRNLLMFICQSKGYSSYISETEGSFSVLIDKNQHPKESIQCNYNYAVIYPVKRILTAYHKKEVLKIGFWPKEQESFDPQRLTKKELGILTKILKLENKRLKGLGIKNRRQKEAYYRNIFLASHK